MSGCNSKTMKKTKTYLISLRVMASSTEWRWFNLSSAIISATRGRKSDRQCPLYQLKTK